MALTLPSFVASRRLRTRPLATSRGSRQAVAFAAGAVTAAVALRGGVNLAGSLVRATTYAGVIVAVGVTAFGLLAHDQAGSIAERDRLRVAVQRGATIAFVASLAQVFVQIVAVSGHGWIGLTQRTSIDLVLRSGLHASTVVRLCGLALLVYAAQRRFDDADTRGSTLLAVNGMAITLAASLVTGHAATRTPRFLAVVVDFAHGLTASVWLGGLVALLIVLRFRRSEGDVAGGAAVVARYSVLMAVTVGVLLASALALTWLELGGISLILHTTYGGVLMAKSGLVAAVLGIGAYNHHTLVPRVEADGSGWSALVTAVRIEIGVLAGVVLLTGVLTGVGHP